MQPLISKTLAAFTRLLYKQTILFLVLLLPEPIAQQLKDGHSSIAEGFAEVTILFADMVGFTQLSDYLLTGRKVNQLVGNL